jgi:hypothetical protein
MLQWTNYSATHKVVGLCDLCVGDEDEEKKGPSITEFCTYTVNGRTFYFPSPSYMRNPAPVIEKYSQVRPNLLFKSCYFFSS